MPVYTYKGAITHHIPGSDDYGQIIDNYWEGETTAPSVKKAKSNLLYQYKKQHNLPRNYSLGLVGNLKERTNGGD